MSALLVALLAAATATHALAPDKESASAVQEPDAAPGPDAPDENATATEADENEPKEDSISLFGSRFSLVAGGAMLWPASSEIRDRFGTSHLSPAFGLWKFREPRGFSFSMDVGRRAFGREDSGDVSIWNVSAGVLWMTRRRTQDAIPYLSLRAGPQLVEIPDRDLRLAPSVTFETGLVLWHQLIVSIRYDLLTRTAGMNLSNLRARVRIRVF